MYDEIMDDTAILTEAIAKLHIFFAGAGFCSCIYMTLKRDNSRTAG